MRRIVALAAAMSLYGCASGPLKLSEVSEKQWLISSDAAQINIDPREFARTDTLEDMWRKRQNAIETGPFWHRAFIGSQNAETLFSIDSTIMKVTIEAMGFAGRCTYIVDGRLMANGQTFPIHAEGTRAFAMDAAGALREAAELGIESAAKQAEALADRVK